MMRLLYMAEEYARATLRDPGQYFRSRKARVCPICNFKGYFLSAGKRQEVRCPACASKERDRALGLHLHRTGFSARGKKILHFSAERPWFRQWSANPGYVAGDIKKTWVSNAIVDITRIQYDDNFFDVLICNHVLEHVDDDQAGMKECLRVLAPHGVAYFSVPQSTLHETWNPPPGTPKEIIAEKCGKTHVRLYGQDFPELLGRVGFKASKIEHSNEDVELYRLNSTGQPDNVYVATKL